MKCAAAILVLATGCVSDGTPTSSATSELTAAKRRERLEFIRDSAAEMGLYNAALLGGVAQVETGLSHCQSELTFACKGPASPSCGGEPIVAGSADGPCSEMQGGLGMFQFDAGTYAQTIALYGESVLTVEGNTALAVSFVVNRAPLEIDGVTDWRSAMAWMNGIAMTPGPAIDEWGRFLGCRYNGCCSTSSTCMSRARGYRDAALEVYAELGGEAAWSTGERCAGIPDGGVIDQRSACYLAAGDPRYWRREPAGHADTSEWTMTTDAATPANYAEWRIRASGPGLLMLEVFLDGGVHGTSTQASYEVHHAGVVDVVTIDQTSAQGFVALGEFMFQGEGDEYVLLGDNTGEPMATQLYFDALRIGGDPGPGPDPDEPPPPGDGGGCDAGGQGGSWLAVLALLRRRRR